MNDKSELPYFSRPSFQRCWLFCMVAFIPSHKLGTGPWRR